MNPRDFSLLLLVCLAWSLHTVLSKIVVTDMAIPPLFYAAVRYAIVAAVTLPWLLPLKAPKLRTILVCFMMGGGGFALFFVGIKYATPSSAAVVQQLALPMTTLLSVMILGETIGWRRGLGIALTFIGAVLLMFDPTGFTVSVGLLFILGSAFVGSLASVMMKQIGQVRLMQFQAWTGFASVWPLAGLSAGLETGQIEAARAAGLPFAAAVLFSALIVSLVSHTLYYGLIRRHPATLIAPLMLISPLMTVALGIAVTGDRFDLRMTLGTVIVLAGVLIITLRRNHVMPLATLLWNRLR